MFVTLDIVNHPANDWDQEKSTSAEELLRGVSPRLHEQSKGLVQTCFDSDKFGTYHITASQNGFVWAVSSSRIWPQATTSTVEGTYHLLLFLLWPRCGLILTTFLVFEYFAAALIADSDFLQAYHAYSRHHHIIICPEDVWFAILSQISFFIKAHAEELRAHFVAHEGKKELEAVSGIPDFPLLAGQMEEILGKHVNDPEMKEWILPGFSTTTWSDRVVGSILFMGAMQKYRPPKMTVLCGLPSVTLWGSVEDWENILYRLDKLDLLGDEPKQFAKLLRPVLRHMIRSFTEPKSVEVIDFWNKIVHRNSVGSGTDYLSGWLTAFCFWDEDGNAKRIPSCTAHNRVLEDVTYPTVDVDAVPAGHASVPVKVDDNGDNYEATMVAGSVGISATAIPTAHELRQRIIRGERLDEPSTVRFRPGGLPIRDTVQPVSGWWMFKN